MTVAEILKKLDKIPHDIDVFIADKNITTWPIQIHIENIEISSKEKHVLLHVSDTQAVLPSEVMDKLVYRDIYEG